MLTVACLLLLASFLMGLSSFYLALLTLALALQLATGTDLLGDGGFAALGLAALWAESGLVLAQTGVLGKLRLQREGAVAAGLGLAGACAACLAGLPWAIALVPLLTAAGCATGLYRSGAGGQAAVLGTLSLMTDPGESRHVRGIMLMLLIAFLLRRAVA